MKKSLIILMCSLFAVSLVAAGVMDFYGMFSTELNVKQPMLIGGTFASGANVGDFITNPIAGETRLGKSFTLANGEEYTEDLPLKLTPESDAGEEGIVVSYTADLVLTQKSTVDWSYDDSYKKLNVIYTVIGDTFEVTGEFLEGYILVYAMDKDARFDNYSTVMKVEDVVGNLPASGDWNANADPNYCFNDSTELPNNGYDSYNQCNGAKIWAVKEDDLSEESVDGFYSLNWAQMADYYYETDMIQYSDIGEITLSPGASLELQPVYVLNKFLQASESEEGIIYTVTTKIE